MKKILVVFFVLFLMVTIAGVFFLATLNVDQYRPQIESQISNALGKPVRLEKISIGWRSGLALSLRGLTIANDPDFRSEFLRLESGAAELNVIPLLTRDIQVSSIRLEHPVIRLVRKPNGQFEGFERNPQGEQPGVKGRSGSPKAAAALSFFVSDIIIESGEIIYRDESQKIPAEAVIRDLDIRIKNASLDQLIDVDIKASLFSRRHNLHVKGNVKVSSESKAPVLRNIRGEVDLGEIDVREVLKAFPSAVAPSDLPEISGQLIMDIDSLNPGARGLKEFSARGLLEKGRLKMAGMKSSLENVRLEVVGSLESVKVQSFSADLADGKISGSASVNLKTPKPLTAFDVSLKNLILEKFLESPRDPQAPELKGVVSGRFQGTVSGSTEAAITQSLAGEGQIDLNRGVVMNLNVIREVFRKLSVIPGLVDNLRRKLPEDYQQKLDARDTLLDPVNVSFAAKDGSVIFNQVNVRTDSFEIQGGGSYGISSGRVGAQANLFVEPELSRALVRSVNELEYLTDRSSGTLKIPLNVQGRVPDVMVTPDLQYIASRLAVSKTQDVLNSFLNKTEPADNQNAQSGAAQPLSSETAASQSPEPPAKKKYPKGKDILGALLQSAIQTEDASSSPR